MGGGALGSLLLRALLFHETQHFPCSPPGYKQNHVQKFPISSFFLKPAVQTGLHPIWNVLLWVSESPSSHSSTLLQDLGCAVLSLHVVLHMPCYTGSWWSPGRHMSQDSGFPMHPSEKQKSEAQLPWSQFSSGISQKFLLG